MTPPYAPRADRIESLISGLVIALIFIACVLR
jgi:hypothetical protein